MKNLIDVVVLKLGIGQWAKTAGFWHRFDVLQAYIKSCWEVQPKMIGSDVYQHYFTALHTRGAHCGPRGVAEPAAAE